MMLDERKFVETYPLFQFKPVSNPRITATQAAIANGESKHGFPDIIPLGVGEGPRVDLTREWQLFIADLNPNMTREKVSAFLSGAVAFTNKTSWGVGETVYQNWLLNEDIEGGNPLPQFDKVRTCSYAIHSGVVEGGELVLNVLNGNLPPPMISEINPLSHPHLFFYATIVWMDTNGRELSRVPFQQRAKAWGHNFEVTVMPLVSKYQVRVPLSAVEAVPAYSLPFWNYP